MSIENGKSSKFNINVIIVLTTWPMLCIIIIYIKCEKTEKAVDFFGNETFPFDSGTMFEKNRANDR